MADYKMKTKEKEKRDKNFDLAVEVKEAMVLPIVSGILGTVG